MEDTEADGGTPTPVSSTTASPAPSNTDELEGIVYELITNERWSAAISFAKHHRGHFNRQNEIRIDYEDDIVFILNIFCKKLIQERPGKENLF